MKKKKFLLFKGKNSLPSWIVYLWLPSYESSEGKSEWAGAFSSLWWVDHSPLPLNSLSTHNLSCYYTAISQGPSVILYFVHIKKVIFLFPIYVLRVYNPILKSVFFGRT